VFLAVWGAMPVIAHCDNPSCDRQAPASALHVPTEEGGVSIVILPPMGWLVAGLQSFCQRACRVEADTRVS
jgi:Fe-S-cluster-containing dehydrogenase component